MELEKGERLIFSEINSRNHQFRKLKILFDVPISERSCCVLDAYYQAPDLAPNCSFYVFLLDNSINANYDTLESHYAQRRGIKDMVMQIVIIPRVTISSGEIVFIRDRELRPDSMAVCASPRCAFHPFGYRCHYIQVCRNSRFNHVLCREHYIPQSAAERKQMFDYEELICEKLNNIGIHEDEYLKARVAHFLCIARMFPEKVIDPEKIAESISETTYFPCPICTFTLGINQTKDDLISDKLMHFQLFPDDSLELKPSSAEPNLSRRSTSNKERSMSAGPTRPLSISTYSDNDDTSSRRRDSFEKSPSNGNSRSPSVGSSRKRLAAGGNTLFEAASAVSPYYADTPGSRQRRGSGSSTPIGDLVGQNLHSPPGYLENSPYHQPNSIGKSDSNQARRPSSVLANFSQKYLQLIDSLSPKVRASLSRYTEELLRSGYPISVLESTILDQSRLELEDMDLPLLKMLVESRISQLKEAEALKEMASPVVKRNSYYSQERPAPLISVTVEYPRIRGATVIVDIKADAEYIDALKAICAAFAFPDSERSAMSMMLTKKTTDGWNIKVDDQRHLGGETEGCLLGMIQNNEVVQLRSITGALIGGRYKLSCISALEKNNASWSKKINQLSDTYEGYLEIRGDGNCYYRAIIFGILEQIINSPNRREGFLTIYSKFQTIAFSESEVSLTERHNKFLTALQDASENKRWNTIEELDSDIINESTNIDIAMIVACKMLVTNYLLNNRHKDYNGLQIENAIMLTNEAYINLEEYCNEEILKMGQCAEGVHVDLGILPSLLSAVAEIAILDKKDSVPLSTQYGSKQQTSSSSFVLSLLFRPGHYDLLYKVGDRKRILTRPLNAVTKVDEVPLEDIKYSPETEGLKTPFERQLEAEMGSDILWDIHSSWAREMHYEMGFEPALLFSIWRENQPHTKQDWINECQSKITLTRKTEMNKTDLPLEDMDVLESAKPLCPPSHWAGVKSTAIRVRLDYSFPMTFIIEAVSKGLCYEKESIIKYCSDKQLSENQNIQSAIDSVEVLPVRKREAPQQQTPNITTTSSGKSEPISDLENNHGLSGEDLEYFNAIRLKCKDNIWAIAMKNILIVYDQGRFPMKLIVSAVEKGWLFDDTIRKYCKDAEVESKTSTLLGSSIDYLGPEEKKIYLGAEKKIGKLGWKQVKDVILKIHGKGEFSMELIVNVVKDGYCFTESKIESSCRKKQQVQVISKESKQGKSQSLSEQIQRTLSIDSNSASTSETSSAKPPTIENLKKLYPLFASPSYAKLYHGLLEIGVRPVLVITAICDHRCCNFRSVIAVVRHLEKGEDISKAKLPVRGPASEDDVRIREIVRAAETMGYEKNQIFDSLRSESVCTIDAAIASIESTLTGNSAPQETISIMVDDSALVKRNVRSEASALTVIAKSSVVTERREEVAQKNLRPSSSSSLTKKARAMTPNRLSSQTTVVSSGKDIRISSAGSTPSNLDATKIDDSTVDVSSLGRLDVINIIKRRKAWKEKYSGLNTMQLRDVLIDNINSAKS